MPARLVVAFCLSRMYECRAAIVRLPGPLASVRPRGGPGLCTRPNRRSAEGREEVGLVRPAGGKNCDVAVLPRRSSRAMIFLVEVENLTPRLREFIWARFQESHLEPEKRSSSVGRQPEHITVLMKPHARVGAEQPLAPIRHPIGVVSGYSWLEKAEWKASCVETCNS